MLIVGERASQDYGEKHYPTPEVDFCGGRTKTNDNQVRADVPYIAAPQSHTLRDGRMLSQFDEGPILSVCAQEPDPLAHDT